MADKPATAGGYSSEQAVLVRAACLYVATKLGDLMDRIVIIGGLVPSLIIDQNKLPAGADPHVGTMDLDVGLELSLLDDFRYRTLTERLRRARFSMDVNERGNPTRQRWKIEPGGKSGGNVTVDFLIPPSRDRDVGGGLRDIEKDFAAVIAPGLSLAFRDRIRTTLSGQTLFGEQATRDVWVCGPSAYVVLKALAFDRRGNNKDAYDLFYVIRNYGTGVEDVADALIPLLNEPEAGEALGILRRDFLEREAIGPRRAAEFQVGGRDDAI